MANPLAHIDGPARDKALELLGYIVEQPEVFGNSVRFMAGGDLIEYHIVRRDPTFQPHPKIESEKWILDLMAASPVLDSRTLTHNSFSFSLGAIEAFKRLKNPDAKQVRSLIGRYLFGIYEGTGEEYLQVSRDAVARAVNIKTEQLQTHLNMLEKLLLIHNVGPINSNDPDVHVQFTSRGYQWAADSCPEDGQTAHGYSSVHIGQFNQYNAPVINIQPVIREIEASSADEQTKKDIEAEVREFQKEPTVEKASRLLSMASSIQQLVPTIAKFIGDNAHYLGNVPHP